VNFRQSYEAARPPRRLATQMPHETHDSQKASKLYTRLKCFGDDSWLPAGNDWCPEPNSPTFESKPHKLSLGHRMSAYFILLAIIEPVR
jgi:hypothetical protein